MAWIAALGLLVTAMIALEALGAERNFRRLHGDRPADPADIFPGWPVGKGIAGPGGTRRCS
jgi:hypothetical protein